MCARISLEKENASAIISTPVNDSFARHFHSRRASVDIDLSREVIHHRYISGNGEPAIVRFAHTRDLTTLLLKMMIVIYVHILQNK